MIEWRVTPPAPPERRPRRGPTAAPEDKSDDADSRDHSSSWSIFIEYEDSTGWLSERRITCIRSESRIGGVPAIFAFCHEAGEPRLFRLDRIKAMANCHTGEILDTHHHIAQLRQHGLPFVNRGMLTVAQILLFIARCDGQHHPAEWDAIEDGMARYALRFGGDDNDLVDCLSKLRCLAPDAKDFTNSLSALVKSPATYRRPVVRLLQSLCADVIDADGRHTHHEIAWGHSLDKIFRVLHD